MNSIYDYIQYGLDKGYIREFCYTHDIPDMTDEEAEEWYDNGDNCISVFQFTLK